MILSQNPTLLGQNPSLPNCLKSNKKYQTKIRDILDEVNTILAHLLKDLQGIYQANSIAYNINHFYPTLVRLLTPFQLINNNSLEIDTNLNNSKVKPLNLNHIQLQQRYQIKSQDLKLIPCSSSQSQRLKKQKDAKGSHKKIMDQKQRNIRQKVLQPKRDKTRPILDDDLQYNLKDWAMRHLANNKWIRRQDLAKKAVKLSKVNNFKGSKGWLRMFLRRHPDLFAQLKRVSITHKGQRKGYYQQNSQQQKAFEEQKYDKQYQKILNQTAKLNQHDNAYQNSFSGYSQSCKQDYDSQNKSSQNQDDQFGRKEDQNKGTKHYNQDHIEQYQLSQNDEQNDSKLLKQYQSYVSNKNQIRRYCQNNKFAQNQPNKQKVYKKFQQDAFSFKR